MIMKTIKCKECGEVKELSHFATTKKTKTGYVDTCKHCLFINKYKQEPSKELKKCSQCGEEKSVLDFYVRSSNPEIKYYPACRSCYHEKYYTVQEERDPEKRLMYEQKSSTHNGLNYYTCKEHGKYKATVNSYEHGTYKGCLECKIKAENGKLIANFY